MTDEKPVELMATLWADYQDGAYNQQLPPGEQHTECKRAFYAGAGRAIMALTHLASDGAEPTADDIALLDQLMGEVTAFFHAESMVHEAMKH